MSKPVIIPSYNRELRDLGMLVSREPREPIAVRHLLGCRCRREDVISLLDELCVDDVVRRVEAARILVVVGPSEKEQLQLIKQHREEPWLLLFAMISSLSSLGGSYRAGPMEAWWEWLRSASEADLQLAASTIARVVLSAEVWPIEDDCSSLRSIVWECHRYLVDAFGSASVGEEQLLEAIGAFWQQMVYPRPPKTLSRRSNAHSDMVGVTSASFSPWSLLETFAGEDDDEESTLLYSDDDFSSADLLGELVPLDGAHVEYGALGDGDALSGMYVEDALQATVWEANASVLSSSFDEEGAMLCAPVPESMTLGFPQPRKSSSFSLGGEGSRLVRGPERAAMRVPKRKAPTNRVKAEQWTPTTSADDKRQSRRAFEKFLSRKAGRPGPVERVLSRFRLCMRGMQSLIGLRVVTLLHACDSALDMVTEYVSRLYGVWLFLRARGKKRRRMAKGTLHRDMAQDLYQFRAQVAACVGFAGYVPEAYVGQHPTEALGEVLDAASFPVERVLSLRGHALSLQQDVKALPSMVAAFAQLKRLRDTPDTEALAEELQELDIPWGQMGLSLIPNPLAWLSSWKDMLVMACSMRYTREEIESMYLDAVCDCRRALLFSLESQQLACDVAQWEQIEPALLRWFGHELAMLSSHQRHDGLSCDEVSDLAGAVKRADKSLQRLLQALSFPARLVSYQRWDGHELLAELLKAPDASQPGVTIAWESWLTRALRRLAKRDGILQERYERMLQRREARRRRSRRRLAASW